MTGYTVHTGSTEKFSQGWDQIFGSDSAESDQPASGRSAAKSRKKTGRKAAAAKTRKRTPAKKK